MGSSATITLALDEAETYRVEDINWIRDDRVLDAPSP
jgi:hypothetical protein